jgi:hypothetical protein
MKQWPGRLCSPAAYERKPCHDSDVHFVTVEQERRCVDLAQSAEVEVVAMVTFPTEAHDRLPCPARVCD